jgi:hypothetical protein
VAIEVDVGIGGVVLQPPTNETEPEESEFWVLDVPSSSPSFSGVSSLNA